MAPSAANEPPSPELPREAALPIALALSSAVPTAQQQQQQSPSVAAVAPLPRLTSPYSRLGALRGASVAADASASTPQQRAPHRVAVPPSPSAAIYTSADTTPSHSPSLTSALCTVPLGARAGLGAVGAVSVSVGRGRQTLLPALLGHRQRVSPPTTDGQALAATVGSAAHLPPLSPVALLGSSAPAVGLLPRSGGEEVLASPPPVHSQQHSPSAISLAQRRRLPLSTERAAAAALSIAQQSILASAAVATEDPPLPNERQSSVVPATTTDNSNPSPVRGGVYGGLSLSPLLTGGGSAGSPLLSLGAPSASAAAAQPAVEESAPEQTVRPYPLTAYWLSPAHQRAGASNAPSVGAEEHHDEQQQQQQPNNNSSSPVKRDPTRRLLWESSQL